jgi:hypothetical protein
MASFTERIRILLEVDGDGATSSFKKFRTSVSEAQGPLGKLKAVGTGAMDAIKNNAGTLALAGGAAVAAFAAKGIIDFQNLGVAVGKFTDATGASSEEASRLIEVAGDLGVEQGTLESAIGRMNKTAGATPEVFKKLGVEIAKTADGATLTNETFLNAVDTLNSIKDPAAKAEAGAALFGRGWQSMAELIGKGAPALRANLAAVSDAKVFDDKKVNDARSLREAFDSVADAVQDLFLQIGTALAPVIAELGPLIAEVVETAGPLVEILGTALAAALKVVGPLLKAVLAVLGPIIDAVGWFATKIEDLVSAIGLGEKKLDSLDSYLARNAEAHFAAAEATEEHTAATEDGADRQEYYQSRVDSANDSLLQQQQAAQRARDEHQRLSEKIDQGREVLNRFRGELDLLSGQIGQEEAFIRLTQQIDDATASIDEAKVAFEEGSISAEDSMRKQALGWIALKQGAIDYGTALGLTPTEITTFVNLIDNGQIDDYERQLAILTRNRQINLDIIARGGAGYSVRVDPMSPTPRFDDGGVMPGPKGVHSLAWVAGGETVLPTHKGPVALEGTAGGSGDTTVIVNANLQVAADPNATGAALLSFLRTGGAAQIRRALGL